MPSVHRNSFQISRRWSRRADPCDRCTGFFIPDADEIAVTGQDWLNEAEHIQLIPRLSDKHQD